MKSASGVSGISASSRAGDARAVRQGLFFTSNGKTCLIGSDGAGLRVFELAVPNQATWQPCGVLPDGRAMLLSMEPRRDGPGRPFDEYYAQTPTRVWAYDVAGGALEELATRNRMAPFYAPQLLLRDERVLMQVCRPRQAQIFNMRLDGADAREFTGPAEGVAYGFSLSPDGARIAFHLASAQGYQIWACDAFGECRVLVAAEQGHLYFGPTWAPDGQWLLYQDCQPSTDPGHDWSDLRVSRPDGSEHRMLTEGQAMWFAATYGYPGNRSSGSNMPAWTRDGQIIFPRRLPGSRPAWQWAADRTDTDHFNRDFRPELARGGTEICRLDPRTGVVAALTSSVPPAWDFRSCESPDGRLIAFCRAATGGVPGLWVMNADGSDQRLLTCGLEDRGVDHPRWFSLAAGV